MSASNLEICLSIIKGFGKLSHMPAALLVAFADSGGRWQGYVTEIDSLGYLYL